MCPVFFSDDVTSAHDVHLPRYLHAHALHGLCGDHRDHGLSHDAHDYHANYHCPLICPSFARVHYSES